MPNFPSEHMLYFLLIPGSMKRPHDEESGRRDDGGHKRRRGGDGPRSEVRVLLQSKVSGRSSKFDGILG